MPDFAELDHYELLGVARNATDAEITAAYDRKWKQVRPDRNPAAHELGISLNSARSTLLDIDRRREYDESLPPERGREERERRRREQERREREEREREEQERNRRERERREREEREREERERRRHEQERREREEREREEQERRRRERERREREEREREERERRRREREREAQERERERRERQQRDLEERERRQREREAREAQERREREERERRQREREKLEAQERREREAREERERAAIGAVRFGLRSAALLFAVIAVATGIIGSVAGAVPSWGPLSFTVFPSIAMLGAILLVTTMRVPTADSISTLIPGIMLVYLILTGFLGESYSVLSFAGATDGAGIRALLAYPAIVVDAQLDASTHQYGALPAICVGIIVGGFWRMGMEKQAKDDAGSQDPSGGQHLQSLAEARNIALTSFGRSAIIAPSSYAVFQTVAFALFFIVIGIPSAFVDIFTDVDLNSAIDGDVWNLWIVVVTGRAAYACGRASSSVPKLMDQMLKRVVRNGERARDWLASGSLMAIALAPSAVMFALIALGGVYWGPIFEPLVEWAYS